MLLRRFQVCLWSVFLGAAAAAQVDERFREGVEAFRRGDDAAAVQAFKEVLAADPGDVDAFAMLQQVEEKVLLEMLVARGEIGALAARFLERAGEGRREIVSDPGNAAELVTTYLEGDELERQRALVELRATFGPWAVPALVRPLGDSDIDVRVLAIQALRNLGPDAVLPLVQVLESDDLTTRRNAAAVLGTLGDARAAAGLAGMAARDDDAVARQLAADALARLGTGTSDPARAAMDLALRYFRGDPEVVRPYDATTVLWSWEDGALEGRQVFGGLFALELAEDYALAALESGGGDEARALLAAIHAAQRAEILAAQQVPELEGNELLEAAAERLDDLKLDLGLAGARRGRAMLLCLSGTPRREAAAVELMRHASGSDEELNALRAALGDPDPGVAQGAALALARLGEVDGRVVAALAQALSGVPARLAVSIGDTGLHGAPGGWYLIASDGVQEGLQRAKAFPPKDVIVVQEGVQGVTLDALVFAIADDPRTAEVPLIVVASDVAGVEELYGDAVDRVVSRASFTDVEEVAGERSAQQQQAVERAVLAAERLASIDTELARQAGAQVNDALARAGDPAVVRAVLDLVARTGMLAAQPSVDALVADEGLDPEVRVAALRAAARLWAQSGGPPSGDVSGQLMAALDSDDAELAAAAAEALGQLRTVQTTDLIDAVR